MQTVRPQKGPAAPDEERTSSECGLAVFELDGRVNAPLIPADDRSDIADFESPWATHQEVVSWLSGLRRDISGRIRRKIRAQLPSFICVQVDVQIQQRGRILTLAGTVALLSRHGPFVFNGPKDELERQVSGLVEAGVRRALNSIFAFLEPYVPAGTTTWTVQISDRLMPSLFVCSLQPRATDAEPPVVPSVVSRLSTSLGVRSLTAAVSLVFVLQLLMLLNRLFHVS